MNERSFGVPVELAAIGEPPACARLVDRGRPQHDDIAAGHRVMDGWTVGERHQCTWRPPVHVLHGRVADRVGGEDHAFGIDVDDRPHLQVGRRDRLTVDDQPPRPIAVGARHQCVGRRHHAGSRHQLDPRLVVVGERSGRRSRDDVDDQHLEITLVARLHHDGQTVLGPVHLGEIREPVAVPGHLGRSAPVDRDEVERDLRVGGPGGGVADGSRWQRRLGRIGDVPHLHIGDIDPADRDDGSIRAPPVAALALHLLGGDEVGASPRDGGRAGRVRRPASVRARRQT